MPHDKASLGSLNRQALAPPDDDDADEFIHDEITRPIPDLAGQGYGTATDIDLLCDRAVAASVLFDDCSEDPFEIPGERTTVDPYPPTFEDPPPLPALPLPHKPWHPPRTELDLGRVLNFAPLARPGDPTMLLESRRAAPRRAGWTAFLVTLLLGLLALGMTHGMRALDRDLPPTAAPRLPARSSSVSSPQCDAFLAGARFVNLF